MSPFFTNVAIDCWQHTGHRLGIAERAICLQADRDACDILLSALDELAAEAQPARRALTLKGSARRKTCAMIRLRLSPEGEDLRQMSVTCAGDAAIFDFTRRGLEIFREAVVHWRNGSEDFSIHPRAPKRELGTRDRESAEVWFWTSQMDP